jgi:cardiolipin synthase
MVPLQDSMTEIIFTHAPDYFYRILNAIEHAKTSIEMETYIFDDDDIGHKVADALVAAAKRGVSVKLLIDGVGACSNFYLIAEKLASNGVDVKIYRPLPWRFDLWPFSLFPRKGVLKFWYLLSFINQRNHRKLLMIDRRVVWLGSFNISQSHLPKTLGGNNWRDTAIELQGINTQNIEVAFSASWSKWSKKATENQLLPSAFLFNFTRALRRSQRSSLLAKITSASERVWITNAYFIPDAKLLDALIIASNKGVDVRILLPSNSDVFFIPWASSYFYSQLLQAKIRIYEYHEGLLHAKSMLIDDWACIGSSNLNTRSLMHDLELDYSLQLEESKQQLAHDFMEDIHDSNELNQKNLNQYRFWQRYFGGVLLLLISYWV